MPSYLFATWSGGGNLPPALAVAAELARRGDRVRVIGHDDQRAAVEAAGIAFEPYPTGLQWRGAADADVVAMFRMFHDPGLGADVVASMRREPVDAVVVDCMLLGVLAAAEREPAPTVVLTHTLLAYWRRWARNPLTRFFSARQGVSALRLWDAAAVNVIAVAPELDAAAERAAVGERRGNRMWVGPVVPDESAPAAGDAILVSLSTNNLPGQRAVLQRAIDGAAALDRPVIVTTGPAIDPRLLRLPAGAEVHRVLPHSEAMRRSALVIGHGGHGTTTTALAHGLPLVMLPLHPMIDQPMVARAVQDAGAGLALPKRASSARIASAAGRALGGPEYRAGAERLGTSIRAARAPQRAADAIAAVLVAH